MALSVQYNKNKSFILCLIYRPVFHLTTDDINFFERLTLELHNFKKDFYICGDFNIHLESESDTQVKKFKSMLLRNHISIITKQPTRKNSMIDFFLSNNTSNIQGDGVIDPHLSDHPSCYITRKCSIKTKKCDSEQTKLQQNEFTTGICLFQ